MDINNFGIGTTVKSLLGHDKDRIYIIIAYVSDDFALVSDGKYREIDKPKLKRLKHLRPIKCEEDKILEIQDKINNRTIQNCDIIKIIKEIKGN